MSTKVDPAAFHRLMAAGGVGLVERMIALFLQHSPDRISSLRAGIDNRDWPVVERAAHSLKSSAAHLGLEDLRTIAARLEDLAPLGAAGQLRPLLDRLTNSFLSARETLTGPVGRLS